MNIYKNKRISIVGLGKTGISCLNFLKNKKSNIYIMDLNKNLNINIKFLKNKINLGSIKISWILKSDLIILSPGISIDTPEIKLAILYNIEITSDLDIFFKEIKFNNNIILITGSNGKTTVSTLVYKILKKTGLKILLGGNIGIPVLNLLKKKCDLYIIEISSFQLEILKNIKSVISIILNIFDNHINRHKSIENYVNCKLKVYINSLNCIFNKDNNLTYPLIKNNYSNYINFGINDGDYKLFFKKKSILIFKKDKFFINCNKLKINNIHYFLNILSVLAITDLIKEVKYKHQLSVIKKFKGIKHRIQIIKNKNKILWINDSKSTNIYSTLSAINTMKKFNYIHIILGGLGLRNFTNLSQFIKYKNIILYIFGKYSYNFYKYFKNLYIYKKKLKEIIFIIKNNALKKDVILFSPSGASFDKYISFEDRGNQYIKLVKNINK